ncbi:hypothetical protein CJ030_MR5G023964 [Morella rubra]|uniref:Uncharacterized protein n=1 Tax=Morella rubra TaxID=262757 RepID=A0A6A1VHS4_9ROSI|nr:hypothetical protein CJ030_MR5G023964 [Morella rubra]
MKRGWEFPYVTSRQLHGSLTSLTVSPIPSPSSSTPSLRPNASICQGTLACPSSCASTLASKCGRGRTHGDHFDLDYTRQKDVRTEVETMMMAHRTHRNRMHAYFKKFPTSEGKDEIEVMKAAREKDLQEFAKKQAKMEVTLRDHPEEQQVEQERIRLE